MNTEMKPKKRKWKKIGRKVSFLVAGMFAISIVALVALCVSMFYKLTMNMMQDQCVNGTNVLAYQLDNYTGPEDKTQLLDDLKELVGCEFTIFDGDVRTYTTIQQDGKRVVGTTLSADLAKTVLEEGQTYVGKAEILGVTHLCSYVPTKDASGKINGLIFSGISLSDASAQINNTIKVACFVGIALIVMVIFLLSIFIRLVITLCDVSNGRPNFGMSKGGGEIPWYVFELPVVVVGCGQPTMLADIPQARTYINTYDNKENTLEILVEKLISGEEAFTGKDPVDSFCGLFDARI